MRIDQLILGDFETNSYCVRADDPAMDCVIIDTGLDAEPLIDLLKQRKFNPVAVVFTHGHADHITGVKALRQNFPEIKVIIHKDDAKMLTSCVRNMSILAGKTFTTDPAEIILEEESKLILAGIEFEVFHTPGHTKGGICLYCETDGIVFVGDTLFASSIGRTDLPGGNFENLITSIKQKLLTLPPETKVLTGHGPETTIGTEKQSNQYLS